MFSTGKRYVVTIAVLGNIVHVPMREWRRIVLSLGIYKKRRRGGSAAEYEIFLRNHYILSEMSYFRRP